MKRIEIFFLALVAVFLLGMASQKRLQNPSRSEVIVKVDTLVIFDTIRVVEPKFERIVKVEKMLIPVVDTLLIRDTLYMVADRTQKEYCSPEFEAWVSGYEPKLDSIKLYPKTKIVQVEKAHEVTKKTKWGVGLQMGFGFTPGGTVPYLGVGVNYNLFSW